MAKEIMVDQSPEPVLEI